jgi:hypothetical protein
MGTNSTYHKASRKERRQTAAGDQRKAPYNQRIFEEGKIERNGGSGYFKRKL